MKQRKPTQGQAAEPKPLVLADPEPSQENENENGEDNERENETENAIEVAAEPDAQHPESEEGNDSAEEAVTYPIVVRLDSGISPPKWRRSVTTRRIETKMAFLQGYEYYERAYQLAMQTLHGKLVLP